MKEIVVISGKGGTGKTSITAAFAVLGGKEVVLADCDVDAADMHLLLKPDFGHEEAFFSGELAVIDEAQCTNCGVCATVCRFDAIDLVQGVYVVDNLGCEGCGYCARVCPEDAISNVPQNVGNWYRSTVKTGTTMVHARLGIGADNSGKLVAKVKNEAKLVAENEGHPWVLVDGAPGVGCPVVSSLSGASFVVLVTEPTMSGLHDLRRVYQLVKKFGIEAGCIVNKADLNPEVLAELLGFLGDENIIELAQVPYDERFSEAMTQGKTIVEWDASLGSLLGKCWDQITGHLRLDNKQRRQS